LSQGLNRIRPEFMTLWSIFDFSTKVIELQDLTKQSEDSTIWADPTQAQVLMKKISDLRAEVDQWNHLKQKTDDILELARSGDVEFEAEILTETDSVGKLIESLEIETLLSGPYDKGNAFLSLNSGAGGTEACDWAGMLLRMYLRWAESNGFKTEVIDQTEGEEVGIKSVTVSISGKNVYGYLRPEKGVHRLVRLSPFDAAHRRHTSFAQVEVLPEASQDDPVIQINPEDLKIDSYRSSGAGGQNVQKNSTAIRITHLPTGLVVSCQNERSQLQNRENAMRVLRARLLEDYEKKQEKEVAELKGEFMKTEWGSQIRSYVLHPYQMVKDHRTDYETSNTQAVLDGEIDPFIEAYLKLKK
jgi:peptide chain release factor 2